MKFFETLRRYRSVRNELWKLNRQKEELQLLLGFPKKSYITAISSNNCGDNSVVAYLDKVKTIDEEIEKLECSIECLRNDLSLFLNKIEDYWIRTVLEMRLAIDYEKKYTWKEIAEKIFYSVSSVRNFYREGLRILDKLEIEVNV